MELSQKIESLYDNDTSYAYQVLQELESLSEHDSALYAYFDRFLDMLKSDKYVIRVRGIRLLCRQAKWDSDNKLNASIDDILLELSDEKPTAVRQTLKALENVAHYKKELCGPIAAKVKAIDCAVYKASMGPLIEKDIRGLLKAMETGADAKQSAEKGDL